MQKCFTKCFTPVITVNIVYCYSIIRSDGDFVLTNMVLEFQTSFFSDFMAITRIHYIIIIITIIIIYYYYYYIRVEISILGSKQYCLKDSWLVY